jgi:hypothetical protein
VRFVIWATAGRIYSLTPYRVRRIILGGSVHRLRVGGRSVVLDVDFAEALNRARPDRQVGGRSRCLRDQISVEMARPPEDSAPRASHELSTGASSKAPDRSLYGPRWRDRTRAQS